ncbi:MAG TPA: hypothetical protein VHA05_01715 [Candidatus Saccharimonadales bacterium]|nr:hypothetical protein [Candidatus Saccharimonadales bacterium]
MREISELAGPQDLRTIFDYRLEESGVKRGRFMGAELLAPTDSALRVEDQTFHVVARDLDGDDSEYSWLQVTPGAGTAETMLSFRDSSVHVARRAIILWSIGDTEDGGTMSPEEIHELYLQVGDPLTRPRKEAIEAFYRNRNAARAALLRPVCRMLGIDRPPKHL